MKILNQSTLNKLIENVTTKKNIFGAVFYVESKDNSTALISASGNIKEDDQYYIASINKLFISAIILKLKSDKKLHLEDSIAKYLSKETISGLHIYKGIDYSHSITITHLLSHTSGLPCYLIDKNSNGKKIIIELINGNDQSWPIEKAITEVKSMKPSFPPGKEGKARYIDTNHQLLSKIIETITEEPVNIALKKIIFDELGLRKTYVCEDPNYMKFVPIYYKSEPRYLPIFLTSTRNDIISTAKDQMTFLKAFFDCHFFPMETLKELEKWNNIFFPFKYGIGIQKFYMPRFLSPFKPVPDMIGHCGSTGSVAFYIPDKDIFITGTVNQQANPNIAFQLMIKIVNLLR
jgi:CubicO group peptidase (beta-lactamase class C family)